MRARVFRIGSERFARKVRALREASALAGDHRQIIVGIGIRRITAQHLAIGGGCGGDCARPVQRQRFLQQFRY
ncbi:MAG: hypothetical protein WBD33_09720 [Xanthobacteraceae bacterium]